MDMNSGFVLAQSDGRPLYLQIMDHIQKKIAVGDWEPGQQIPSIRALAVELSISVITVKRAYLELERHGVITTHQGRGSFVAANSNLGIQLVTQEFEECLKKTIELASILGIDAKRLNEIIQKRMQEVKNGSCSRV